MLSAPTVLPPAVLETDLAARIHDLLRAAEDPPVDASGRPGKFSPDVLARIVTALRMGHTVPDACTFAGVRTDTYKSWLRKGQNGEEPYALLCDVIERLNVAAYSHAVQCFSKGAAEDPKVAERFLARRAPKEWGTKEDSSGGGSITVMFGLELRGSSD